jgi:hypothetical protein
MPYLFASRRFGFCPSYVRLTWFVFHNWTDNFNRDSCTLVHFTDFHFVLLIIRPTVSRFCSLSNPIWVAGTWVQTGHDSWAMRKLAQTTIENEYWVSPGLSQSHGASDRMNHHNLGSPLLLHLVSRWVSSMTRQHFQRPFCKIRWKLTESDFSRNWLNIWETLSQGSQICSIHWSFDRFHDRSTFHHLNDEKLLN